METARNAISLLSYFVLPLILVGFPLYGLYKRVPVYESFVEGAKEGFQVAVRIIPYLVAILFAIAMFRASGAMEALTRALDPVLGLIGFPAELLPMAIIRSLSGSGSAALVADMINQYGEDLDLREDGLGHVRVQRDHLLRDRGVFRGDKYQEDTPRGAGGPHRGRGRDAHRGVDGTAAVPGMMESEATLHCPT